MPDPRAQLPRLPAALALAAALLLAPAASASAAARVETGKRCYAVGKPVTLTGSGFLPSSEYDVALDGVDFGQSTTDASGGFRTSFQPGGLAAGQAQMVERVDASDGASDPSTTFTLTRPTGALFGAGKGSSAGRRVPFQVWDFGRAHVYLHYVHAGAVARTVALGTTTGQCGYLRTAPRPLFPFTPGAGRWVLQFDSQRRYAAHPRGPVARLGVTIG